MPSKGRGSHSRATYEADGPPRIAKFRLVIPPAIGSIVDSSNQRPRSLSRSINTSRGFEETFASIRIVVLNTIWRQRLESGFSRSQIMRTVGTVGLGPLRRNRTTDGITDPLIRHEGDLPAVGRPARDVDAPLAAEEPAQHIDLLARERQLTQADILVGGVAGHVLLVREEDQRAAVGRRVGEPVVEFVGGNRLLVAAVGLHGQICIVPVRTELK